MALVSRLPSSSSSSLIQSTKPTSFGIRPVFTVHCVFNSQKASPFTEKHSIERYQRDSWVYKSQQQQKPSCSCPPPSDDEFFRDYDIALQLPELKILLQVLREKREFENGSERKIGNVFLVGTGPGDPDLLTLKALRVIESADLLLYDRLVSNEVLNLVGPDAKLLYVGKTAGYHSRTQEEIHELLLSFAEAGASVVRLKGGDPLASFLKICLTYNLYTFSMYSEGAERRWTFYNNKELRSKSFQVGVIIIPRKYIMGKVDEKAFKTLMIVISAFVCILLVGCFCIFILTNGVSKEMKLRATLISHLDARRKAEASNNYKSQFLANMSHELRTPMAAVIGLMDILISDDRLTTEQHAMITQIRKCSTALLRLLNNILDIGKVESGKLILEEIEFDLGRELEGLIDMLSVQCINHNVETVLDLSDDMPKIVLGDSGRVLQVFANLISNSIKFTN